MSEARPETQALQIDADFLKRLLKKGELTPYLESILARGESTQEICKAVVRQAMQDKARKEGKNATALAKEFGEGGNHLQKLQNSIATTPHPQDKPDLYSRIALFLNLKEDAFLTLVNAAHPRPTLREPSAAEEVREAVASKIQVILYQAGGDPLVCAPHPRPVAEGQAAAVTLHPHPERFRGIQAVVAISVVIQGTSIRIDTPLTNLSSVDLRSLRLVLPPGLESHFPR